MVDFTSHVALTSKTCYHIGLKAWNEVYTELESYFLARYCAFYTSSLFISIFYISKILYIIIHLLRNFFLGVKQTAWNFPNTDAKRRYGLR